MNKKSEFSTFQVKISGQENSKEFESVQVFRFVL